MLIIKAFINEMQIDEIHIQNVGHWKSAGVYEYAIQQPKGKWPTILHRRNGGWKKLFGKVLSILGEVE